MVFIGFGIVAFIGLGVFLYFMFKSKTKTSDNTSPDTTTLGSTQGTTTSSDTTTPGTMIPGTTTTPGMTSPYIAVDPIFPPSTHYENVVDDLNKLNPTKPTDNGEVTVDNVSVLLKTQNVLPHTDNMTIQTLFNMGNIMYDDTINKYVIAPANYHPPSYGKPTLSHIIDVLNTQPIKVNNDTLYYTAIPLSEVAIIVPGITNKTLQSLFNVRFKLENGMFVKI